MKKKVKKVKKARRQATEVVKRLPAAVDFAYRTTDNSLLRARERQIRADIKKAVEQRERIISLLKEIARNI
jgi:hypothetical protein